MLDYKILDDKLIISGDFNKNSGHLLLQNISSKRMQPVNRIELKEVKTFDSTAVAVLEELLSFSKSEIPIIFENDKQESMFESFSSKNVKIAGEKKKTNFFIRLGEKFYDSKDNFVEGMFLTSDIIYFSLIGFFQTKERRKGSIVNQSILIGVNALPIILLLSLVIGLILALQSAAQLRQFGANIFIADLIAISMVREMGPMMTAIIMAGRTGSSIASEIATMKVTEEVDAIKMMALNPISYIVVPKMYAITLCMPVLVAVAIVVGILGGLVIAVFYLGLTPVSYITEAFNILAVKDFVISFSKSVFFAWVIVIIGSFYGFNVSGGAEGVGKATTKAVVASIFAVIVFDALFSLSFLAG